MARSSFGKHQREQAKRAKAAAKRDRRQQPSVPDDADGADGTDETATTGPGDVAVSTDELLDKIAQVHAQYDAGTMSLEDFEAARTDLLGRLVVD
jgi:hypothetical protein